MLRLCLLASVLAGCEPERRDQVAFDAAEADAVPEYVRPVTDVLVTPSAIWWTYGTEARSDFGYAYGGPTLAHQDVPIGGTYVSDNGAAGAMAIAGDQDSVFIITGASHDERYLRRVDSVALSIPRPWTQGPAVDDAYVYWAEQPAAGGAYALRKALRTGDGSDATTIAQIPYVTRIAAFGGYLWGFDNLGQLFRAPTSGGPIESVSTDVISMSVAPSALYVGRASAQFNGPAPEIGRFDANGVYTAVVGLDRGKAPFLVADDRDVFWSGQGANALESVIYRYSLSGGAVEAVAAQVHEGRAFGVAPDKLLFDFTPEGFQTRSR